jgi:hypothetical protein
MQRNCRNHPSFSFATVSRCRGDPRPHGWVIRAIYGVAIGDYSQRPHPYNDERLTPTPRAMTREGQPQGDPRNHGGTISIPVSCLHSQKLTSHIARVRQLCRQHDSTTQDTREGLIHSCRPQEREPTPFFNNISTTSTRRATSQHRLAASKPLVKSRWGGHVP